MVEDTRQAGAKHEIHQAYGGRGIYVPEGMTAREIVLGANTLMTVSGINYHWEAQAYVRAILAAIRSEDDGKIVDPLVESPKLYDEPI